MDDRDDLLYETRLTNLPVSTRGLSMFVRPDDYEHSRSISFNMMAYTVAVIY